MSLTVENDINIVKFRYCEKAIKFEKIDHLFLKLISNVKTKWEVISNFCGLLRISGLYKNQKRFPKMKQFDYFSKPSFAKNPNS